MERQTISVHGHQISYRTGGSGPAVLLIHGMAGSSAAWKPILEDLGQHGTYVAPDLPGHGYSDKPRADYSLGAQASFWKSLMSTTSLRGREDSLTIVPATRSAGE